MVNVPLDKLPPASASRRAYLASGWWHLNMAVQATDTTIYHQYQHKWLKFREDQTFDILINNEVADTGRWNWDDKNNVFYISCRDPYINNTWQVKEKGSVMIWAGNTDLNVTGIQIRLVGSKTPPGSFTLYHAHEILLLALIKRFFSFLPITDARSNRAKSTPTLFRTYPGTGAGMGKTGDTL